MAETSSQRAARIVRNTLANGVGTFIGIAIGLVVTPLIIADLGLAAYGAWTLALTLTYAGGYAAIADLGVEAAAIRFVAEAHSDDDAPALNRVASTTLTMFSLLGFVIAAVVFALAAPLVDLFKISGDLRDDAILLFQIVGLQIVFEAPSRAYMAVLRGAEHFIAVQAIQLGRAVLQAVLWIGGLALGFGLEALGFGLAISTVAVILASAIVTHRMLPGLSMRPKHASRAELRRLMGYGSKVLVLQVLGTIYRQMDKAILGVVLGPAAVALYDIADKIVLFGRTVLNLSTSALMPAAAALRNDAVLLRDMYLRGTVYSMAITVPVVIGSFALAEGLIIGWIGEDAREAVGPAQLYLPYLLIYTAYNVGFSMLIPLGFMRQAIGATVANVGVNLVLSIALVGPLGIEGVIIGTLAGAVAQAPILLITCQRRFGVRFGHWARRVLVPQIPGALLQAAFLALAMQWVSGDEGLIVTGIVFSIAFAVSLAGFALTGLRGADRVTFFQTLRSAVGR